MSQALTDLLQYEWIQGNPNVPSAQPGLLFTMDNFVLSDKLYRVVADAAGFSPSDDSTAIKGYHYLGFLLVPENMYGGNPNFPIVGDYKVVNSISSAFFLPQSASDSTITEARDQLINKNNKSTIAEIVLTGHADERHELMGFVNIHYPGASEFIHSYVGNFSEQYSQNQNYESIHSEFTSRAQALLGLYQTTHPSSERDEFESQMLNDVLKVGFNEVYEILIDTFANELQTDIYTEKFEQAAVMRDKIRHWEMITNG